MAVGQKEVALMHLWNVEFFYEMELKEPVYLELKGMTGLIPMAFEAGSWRTTVELPAGVYVYRYRVGETLALHDVRRSTQRIEGGEFWSVLRVDPQEGPVWVDRRVPIISCIQTCRGINEAYLPLAITDRFEQRELPLTLWVEVQNLFFNAFFHIFLIRPDGMLALGSEYVLTYDLARPDYSLRLHFTIDMDSEQFIPGIWKFLLRAEGSPIAAKEIVLTD